MTVPMITLNCGIEMPQLGFGFDRPFEDEAEAAVGTALEVGCRLLDTASYYRNESGIGRAIAASGIPRDQLFITTKLWNADHGTDGPPRSLDESLEKLGTDYVDLYLMHWPAPAIDRYVESWQAMERLVADGRTRAIGVSNFDIEHLERLRRETDTVPALNQVELHPTFQQVELRKYHDEHGILTEAWRPLALGQQLDEAVLQKIADAHGRTAAQVVLRWHMQLGNATVPKSRKPDRIRANFEVFDFELSDDELEAIAALDRGEAGRTGPRPDEFSAVTDAEVEVFIAGTDPTRPLLDPEAAAARAAAEAN